MNTKTTMLASLQTCASRLQPADLRLGTLKLEKQPNTMPAAAAQAAKSAPHAPHRKHK